MRIHIILAGAAVSLAACSQPAPSGNTSTTTTTKTTTSKPAAILAAKPPARIPGEWEYVSKIELLDVQGGPPGMTEQMKKASPPVTTRRECMSKAEAEEDINKAVQKDQGGCRFERIQTSAGTIAGTAVCSNGGMEATGEMNGTVKPTAIDMTVDMTMKLPTAGNSAPASMKMRMQMSGKRVGDCPK